MQEMRAEASLGRVDFGQAGENGERNGGHL